MGLEILWICKKLHNIGGWEDGLRFLKNTVWEVNRITFLIYVLLQSNTSTRNIIKQSTLSPDTDFSNVTRLFIPLKSTFQYMQHWESQVFKSLSFEDYLYCFTAAYKPWNAHSKIRITMLLLRVHFKFFRTVCQ